MFGKRRLERRSLDGLDQQDPVRRLVGLAAQGLFSGGTAATALPFAGALPAWKDRIRG